VLWAVDAEPLEHPNGPPAMAPTPVMIDDQAMPNWTAMKAPDERTEIDVWARAALNGGSLSSAAAH